MKVDPNILFVNLPSRPFDDILASFKGENLIAEPISMPMGILYISSYIKQHNSLGQVGILDYALAMGNISRYKNLDEFIIDGTRKINFIPDILAFSLIYSTAHKIFTICIEKLKSFWPKATTIVGGTHATCCVKEILEKIDVDYLVRGEGELVFSEFINKYSYSEEIKVKGIYNKKDIILDKPLEVGDYIKDLNALPFPDWKLISMERYINARGRKREFTGSKESKFATMITTRGCPFKCTFCASHVVHGRTVRFRTPENVAEEVKYLYEHYGVTLIIPEDDMFTIPKDRCLNMLSALELLNIPDFEIQLPSGLSVNTLDEKIIDKMINAGVKIFTIAIESGSEYVQKNIIKKNCNLKKAKEIVKYLKSKQVTVRTYFILGLFSETIEQMHETIEYAKILGADWCVFMIATPLIGSEMYNQMVNAGYIKNDIDLWSKAFFQDRNFDTPEISACDLKELVYRANLECNFINNINKVSGNYEKAIEIYNDIVFAYPFHIIGWYCIMKCYEALQNFEKVLQLKEKITELIKCDKRSTEIFNKYYDLMPDFIFPE
mgnify:FL=1